MDMTLPVSSKILITSALPYVNNVPHLGNIVGCVLPADVIAHYRRSKGAGVLHICGADEHGTATEVKAREEGVAPRQLCGKYYALHKEIYEWFGTHFDHFGRTSTPNPRTNTSWPHTVISQDIFSKLESNGFLEGREVVQLSCPALNKFVADRYVVETCPRCGDDKAKGDQCDKCQEVYEATELIDPHLRDKPDAALERRSSRHLYLRLDRLQPQLEAWFGSVKNRWPVNAASATEAWFRQGLKPRCITRDLERGRRSRSPAI